MYIYITCNISYRMFKTLNVIYHISKVMYSISHIGRNKIIEQVVTYDIQSFIYHTSYIIYQISYIIYHISCIIYPLSYIIYDIWYIIPNIVSIKHTWYIYISIQYRRIIYEILFFRWCLIYAILFFNNMDMYIYKYSILFTLYLDDYIYVIYNKICIIYDLLFWIYKQWYKIHAT